MPEPLKIGVQVNTSALGDLARASENVASRVSTMAAQFKAGGLSAEECASALENLGIGAKTAAEAAGVVSVQTRAASNSVDSLTRALATSGVKLAGVESGVAALTRPFAALIGSSQALAPVVAGVFPVFAATAMVDVVGRLYEKLRDLEFSAFRNAEAWQRIDHESTAMLAHIDAGIASASAHVAEFTSRKLAELQVEMSNIGDGAVQMAGPIQSLFEGIGKQLEAEKPWFDSVKEFFEFISSPAHIMLPDQGELSKAFGADLAKTLDTEGLSAGIQKVSNQIRIVNQELAKTPTDSALQEYASQLIRVLGILEAREMQHRKQVEENQAAQARAAIEASNKIADDEARANQEMVESAKKEFAEFERIQRGKIILEVETAAEVRKLDELEAKANAKARLEIDRESAESYSNFWREAVKQQTEALRDSQRQAQLALSGARAAGSMSTAGLLGGPIHQALQGAEIAREMEIARAAIQKAEQSASSFNLQLAALGRAQSQVDTSTEIGAREYQALQEQIDQLDREYDTAKEAALHWADVSVQLGAQQKQVFGGLGLAAQNSIESAANSFHTGFLKMITGGQNFSHTMQRVWTEMAESFISSILKMAERWAAAEIMKLGVAKAANTASTADTLSQNLIKRLDNAKTAATNAMANIPTPLNFVLAPVVFAATLAFKAGGVVPGNAEAGTVGLLHGGEMILPSHLSKFVQSAAAGASMRGAEMPGSTPGRPVHLHYHANVSGISTEGIEEMLNAHGDRIFDFMRQKLRRMGQNLYGRTNL